MGLYWNSSAVPICKLWLLAQHWPYSASILVVHWTKMENDLIWCCSNIVWIYWLPTLEYNVEPKSNYVSFPILTNVKCNIDPLLLGWAVPAFNFWFSSNIGPEMKCCPGKKMNFVKIMSSVNTRNLCCSNANTRVSILLLWRYQGSIFVESIWT